VGDNDLGQIGIDAALDQRCHRSVAARLGKKFMGIVLLAAQGYKQGIRGMLAAVGGDALDMHVGTVRVTLRGFGDAGEGELQHGRAPSIRRATSRSSKAWRTPAIS